MTEEQAREAKRLIEAKDNIDRLQRQILSRHRSATKDKNQEDIDWLANTAIGLQEEVLVYIKREIQNI